MEDLRRQINFPELPNLDPAAKEASEKRDKESLLQLHDLGASVVRHYEMQIAPKDRYLERFSSEFPRCSVPLKHLSRISFDNLKVDHVHEGRKLEGKLCAEAFRTVSGILTLLEDNDNKKRAVRLAIFNDPATTSPITLQALQILYPKGAEVAVKEPCLKSHDNSGVAIVVSYPDNIVRLDLLTVDVEEILKKGNDRVRGKDWHGAIDSYTECIEAASVQLNETSPNDHYYLKNKRGLLRKAYCNRAQMRLKLTEFDSALRDSNKALEIDPRSCKALYRKGLALLALGEHEDACKCFTKAADASFGNGDILNALQGEYHIEEQL